MDGAASGGRLRGAIALARRRRSRARRTEEKTVMAAIVTCDTLRVRIWLRLSRALAKTHTGLVLFRPSHWLLVIEFFSEVRTANFWFGFPTRRSGKRNAASKHRAGRARANFSNARCQADGVYSLLQSEVVRVVPPECVSRGAQKPRAPPVQKTRTKYPLSPLGSRRAEHRRGASQ